MQEIMQGKFIHVDEISTRMTELQWNAARLSAGLDRIEKTGVVLQFKKDTI